MAKNIKGITIELEGDSSGLTKALKKVDSETKSVQSELKQIDRLLKFDPSNVELLAQKQQLLGKAIDNTSTRLDALRQAQSQVEQQFKNGEIGEEAFRKFQREIIATEGKLKAFKSQAESTKVKIEVQADTSGIDKIKSSLKEIGDAAKQAAKDVGSALSGTSAVGSAAVTGIVVESDELNKALARLRTNASLSGHSLDVVEGSFKRLSSVTDDPRAAIEAVSNIMASGFNDQQLTAVLEEITGAYIEFSDTLSAEGIADGIQETLAVGEATGPFLELLERSEIAGEELDKFNDKLAKAKKNGSETDVVFQQLTKLGLKSSYEEYKRLYPELEENAEATLNMQMALADLAIVLTPLITLVTELLTKIIDWAKENPELVTTLASIAGIITAVTVAVMALAPIFTALASIAGLLGVSIGAIAAPVAIAIAAITALIAIGVLLWQNWDTVSTWLSVLWEGIKLTAETVWNAIATFFTGLWTTITTTLVTAWEGIKIYFSTLWTAITATVTTVWNGIKSFLSTIWNGIKSTVTTVFNAIKGTISSIWNGIKSFITSTATSIWTTISGKFQSIVNSVAEKMNDVFSKIKEIWGYVTNFFDGIDLGSIGKNIIQGLIDGIGSMKDFVIDIIEDTIGSAIDFAKSLLGIHSPSRVFFEMGEFTNEGFIKGIENTSRQLNNAVGDVYGSLASSAEKAYTNNTEINNLNSVVNNNTTGTIDEIVKNILGNLNNNNLSNNTKQPIILQVNLDKRALAQELVPDITEYQNLNTGIRKQFST